ncbi:MAG: hypothetical protein ABIF84_01600 [Patescibacteria group bacterium]
MSKKKIFSVFGLVLLMAWLGLFFMRKIDLTTADLGRHLKNGELILNGQFGILKTNFYSYTEPDYPMVNHHWGSGVIFYLIWKAFGFTGLSLFHLIVSLIIFYLFFRIAWRESNFKIAFLAALLLIPLMAARTEIRPEIFSYLFIALFFWILWHWRKGEIKDKWLWLLPILEIIWVNTHIYFIFGPALIGLFLVDRWISVKKINRKIGLCLILTGLASLISPFGLKGLLYPFNIFRDYGYRIVENQSVWFLENWGWQHPNLTLFELSFAVLAVSFILLLIKNRRNFSFIYFCSALVVSAMAWLAIRNFTLFGFFALPIIAYQLKKALGKRAGFKSIEAKMFFGFLGLTIFLVCFAVYYSRLPLQKARFGFDLLPGNNLSAQFFRETGLKGPIFNNYDIGGYLIYHFYPQEKVFTDNRPEAYSIGHFQETYIPAQQDNQAWQELDKQYNFNIIFFSHRDYTPWGQQFLIERVNDGNWLPIMADNYAIIFIKNNQTNQEIIKQYQIPREYFGVKKQ